MDNFDIPKFLGEGQNVDGECTSAQPFRDRASHVELPSTVLPVPFSGIRACETEQTDQRYRGRNCARAGGGDTEGKRKRNEPTLVSQACQHTGDQSHDETNGAKG